MLRTRRPSTTMDVAPRKPRAARTVALVAPRVVSSVVHRLEEATSELDLGGRRHLTARDARGAVEWDD